MDNLYLPISTETTKNTFFSYINSVDIPQIDYFAIGVQNMADKRSISLMSREEWQNIFTNNQYAMHDPVRRATLLTKRKIIPFNEIDFIDNYGREIMRQRALMEIKNGIIFVRRSLKFNYMITLGTNFSKFNAFDFIKRYHDKIILLEQDLTKLIEKDKNLFLPQEILKSPNIITDLSVDAK